VKLKGALQADKVESFSAPALVGASPERKKAYSDKVANTTGVVILGEDALKAMAEVEFTTFVFVLNATGRVRAAVTGLLGTDKEVAFKGTASTVIQGILDALK
jgi:hypothetical protein